MAETKAGESSYDHPLELARPGPSRPAPRRDPRADPDDDIVEGRVDNVTPPRASSSAPAGSSDPLSSAAFTLRRELARLQQQAAAVERTIEDQRRERSDALERVESAEAELQALRERALQSNVELLQLREELAESKAELARIRQETAEAAEASAKRTSEAELARASVEGELETLERSVIEARAATGRLAVAEVDLANANKEIERLRRELESAVHEVASTNARAAAAERARAVVEDHFRQLRDEVTTAFARWRLPIPSSSPRAASSAAPPTRAVPLSIDAALREDEDFDSLPLTRRGSASLPALAAEARPFSLKTPPPMRQPSSMPPSPFDEGWSSGQPESRPSRSRPPPLPTRRPTIPPVIYPSVLPAGAIADGPPDEPPSGYVHSKERDDLLELLAEPKTARAVVTKLREHPEWLQGRPPVELLFALAQIDYDVEAPVFDLAWAWEREPIARALIAALRDEPDPKLREHGAWLLKHFGTAASWPALAELISNDGESPTVRRWLIEAVARLTTGRALGWKDVGDLVTRMVRHADASLRDGVIGVIAALDRVDEKRRLLLEVLRTDDDEIVLASAVHALASALPIDLDPAVTERLLGHASPRVEQSVKEFIERSKRTAKQA